MNTIADEKNIGRNIKISLDKDTSFEAKITSVANDEHYFAIITNHPYKTWPWMVRSDSIEFI